MKIMTNELREKLKIYIKNKIDISDLIKDVDIRGEDLSYAIIRDFNRTHQDMSGTKFMYAVIGEEGKVTNLSYNRFLNCRFDYCKFLGRTYLRHCILDGSHFDFANMINVEFQYSQAYNCDFCETAIRLGSAYFYKGKVDQNLFKDLTKYLNLEVKIKEAKTVPELEQKSKEE